MTFKQEELLKQLHYKGIHHIYLQTENIQSFDDTPLSQISGIFSHQGRYLVKHKVNVKFDFDVKETFSQVVFKLDIKLLESLNMSDFDIILDESSELNLASKLYIMGCSNLSSMFDYLISMSIGHIEILKQVEEDKDAIVTQTRKERESLEKKHINPVQKNKEETDPVAFTKSEFEFLC